MELFWNHLNAEKEEHFLTNLLLTARRTTEYEYLTMAFIKLHRTKKKQLFNRY